jgi:hypothetical protein
LYPDILEAGVNHLERTRKAMKLLKRHKMKALEEFLQGKSGRHST